MGRERKLSPWLIGAGCLAIGLGVGTATVIGFQRQSGLPAAQMEGLTVVAERAPLTLRIRANGSVVPIRSVNLSPKNAGRLERLLVNQGDEVAAGDLIAIMESSDLDALYLQARARQAQAEARLAELQAGERPLVIDQITEEIRQARSQMALEAAQVFEAQAQIVEIEAQIAEAQAQFDLAEQQLKRNRTLAAEGAIAQDRLDELTTAVNRAQANLERVRASKARAEAGVLRAQASQAQGRSRLTSSELRRQDAAASSRPEQIEQARAQVIEALGRVQEIESRKEESLIRAPFDGIITQRYADPGAFVTPTTSASSTASATSTSVVAIAQGLEILANVPEVDIDTIRPGQVVEITADAFTEKTFLGEVRLIAPEAVQEQNVTSFQVRVALTQGQEQLRSGMNVDLSFLGENLRDALVVPTVAIVTRSGERGVLVPDKRNQPMFLPVTTGVSIGDQTQILDGLAVGERVFIDLPSDRRFQGDGAAE